jgi:hypothetical protein
MPRLGCVLVGNTIDNTGHLVDDHDSMSTFQQHCQHIFISLATLALVSLLVPFHSVTISQLTNTHALGHIVFFAWNVSQRT